MKLNEALDLDQPITTDVIKDELEINTPIQASVFLRRCIEISPFEFVEHQLPEDITSDLNKLSTILMADKPSQVLLDIIEFSKYLVESAAIVSPALAKPIAFLEDTVQKGDSKILRDFIWHDHFDQMFGFTEYFMMGCMILSNPILKEAYESLLEVETIKKNEYLKRQADQYQLIRDAINEAIQSSALPLARGSRNNDDN